MICKEIMDCLEKLAPVNYAESWDNVGLLVGREDQEIKRIMIALDATESVIDQCIINQVDLLITHHPLIFSGLKQITWNTAPGRKILKLIQNNIGCYAIHTNFDVKVMAEQSAKKLDLSSQQVLEITDVEQYYKLVVYVPTDSVEKVRIAMTRFGGGHIGNYSDCTFGAQGTGTFLPLEGTTPYIGTVNELEETREVRLETILKKEQLKPTIQAVIRVHPYEEVAYDVYELKNAGKEEGIGRVGYLKQDMTMEQLARIVKEQFELTHVTMIGERNKRVAKVAISTGAGKSMVKHAIKAKADVLITGDIDHHTALDAMEAGLMIIDATHFGTEHFMAEYLKEYINVALRDGTIDYDNDLSRVEVMIAKEEHPFTLV